ncbi:MAG: histidine phosphatase family protein [Brevefilum sp.]|nr:histidine phosphatase family protein [Brevefilum sp.]
MAVFLMVRHGHNDMIGKKLAGRLPNVHLNQEGRAQAKRLAEAFVDLPITVVYASPLERAIETAQPIADAHDLPVKIHPPLMEIDFGQWEGEELDKLKHGRVWKHVQGKPSEFRFPGGESFAEAQERMVDGLLSLSQEFSEKEIVVVTAHSDVIRLAVAHFLGLPLDNFQRIRIHPASVTVLYLNDNQGFFGPINYTFEFPKL